MTDEKIIKDAQYRKGLSIGFFNATNSAIALVSASIDKEETDEMLLTRIRYLREIFIEDHKKYYASVISQIGKPYNSEETIKKIREIKTIEELKELWHSLSEDERHDGEIRKVVKELKSKLK